MLKVRQKIYFLLLPSNQGIQSNYINVIVVFAFMGHMCIQTSSPTTN